MIKLNKTFTYIIKLFKSKSKKELSLDGAVKKFKKERKLGSKDAVNIKELKEWMDKSNIYTSKDDFFKTTIKKGITHEK